MTDYFCCIAQRRINHGTRTARRCQPIVLPPSPKVIRFAVSLFAAMMALIK
jgi:hypothetical protein